MYISMAGRKEAHLFFRRKCLISLELTQKKILPVDLYVNDIDGGWGTSLPWGARGQGHCVVI